jgi:hypothetical protein
MAVTNSKSSPAVIESGRVLDVDMKTYTLTVATEFTKKPQTGVPFATPYQHFANGEGIYFMPEVGSVCWLCFPSDGHKAFVLAWRSAPDEGDNRAKKKELNPGDIYLGTRDENFLVLRRGGVVQIGGGPICQRIFLPIENTINDFCENYGLHTLAGSLEWGIAREEKTTDGKRPATLKVHAREFADDAKPIALLEIGSHESDKKTILSLVIKESGKDGAAKKVELSLDKDGNLKWKLEKDVEWSVKGKFSLEVEKDISVKSKTGKMDLEAKQAFSLKAQQVTVESQTGVTVKANAPVEISAPMINAGGNTSPVALATPLMIWLAAHTHLTTVPGSPTSPAAAAPTGPPPGNIVSTKLFSA